jgi:hypothetical protein
MFLHIDAAYSLLKILITGDLQKPTNCLFVYQLPYLVNMFVFWKIDHTNHMICESAFCTQCIGSSFC